MTAVQRMLLALRVVLEVGVVAGLAWWGYRTGGGGGTGALLAILVPTIGFGIWGAVDFHRAGRLAEPLRLTEELLISGLAAVGLIAVGPASSGWGLLGFSVVYHLLVYTNGERLLTHTTRRQPHGAHDQDPQMPGPSPRRTR